MLSYKTYPLVMVYVRIFLFVDLQSSEHQTYYQGLYHNLPPSLGKKKNKLLIHALMHLFLFLLLVVIKNYITLKGETGLQYFSFPLNISFFLLRKVVKFLYT